MNLPKNKNINSCVIIVNKQNKKIEIKLNSTNSFFYDFKNIPNNFYLEKRNKQIKKIKNPFDSFGFAHTQNKEPPLFHQSDVLVEQNKYCHSLILFKTNILLKMTV